MSRNPFRKGVGFYEVKTTSNTSGKNAQTVYNKSTPMEEKKDRRMHEKEGPQHESPRNVGFNLKDQHKENKKKYLTAKYGAHQMLLIKKRLGVEMWIFDELRKLYNSENDDHPCNLELEDILNYDSDAERREYAESMLEDAKQSKEAVDNFLEELLKRANTL